MTTGVPDAYENLVTRPKLLVGVAVVKAAAVSDRLAP
jgi:hypothetical protein